MSSPALLGLAAILASTPTKGPPELGSVHWRRDLAAGLAEAEKSGRPALVLFDEIPGCSTVLGFGTTVLDHPLIVEALETLFVPIAIYNNTGGADRDVLRAFDEPAWNNPVVRVLRPDKRPLGKRFAGPYTVEDFARALVAALADAGKPAPAWLALLAAPKTGDAKATFGMYCFWAGEAALGGVDGVVRTRAGFQDGQEVVEVEYDPARLPYERLLGSARAAGATPRGPGQLRFSEKDSKYHLAASRWRFVPMTETQQSRVNAALAAGSDPRPFLSERQLAVAAAVERHPDAGWTSTLGELDLAAAFAGATALETRLASR